MTHRRYAALQHTHSGSSSVSLALSDLTDVGSLAYTARHVLVADGTDYDSRLLVEADISDLQSYSLVGHTHLQADITDANDANWDTAYGWGDHSGLYLPLSGGSLTGGVSIATTGSQLTLWDTAATDPLDKWVFDFNTDMNFYHYDNSTATWTLALAMTATQSTFNGLVKVNGEIWSTSGFSTQGTVTDYGQPGQFTFVDVSAGIGRVGSYNYDTAAWMPMKVEGLTVEIDANGGLLELTGSSGISMNNNVTADGTITAVGNITGSVLLANSYVDSASYVITRSASGGSGAYLDSTASWTTGTLYGPGLRWREADGTSIAGIRGYVNSSGLNRLALGTSWLNTVMTLGTDNSSLTTSTFSITGAMNVSGNVDVESLDIVGGTAGNTHFGHSNSNNYISHLTGGFSLFRSYDGVSAYTTVAVIRDTGLEVTGDIDTTGAINMPNAEYLTWETSTGTPVDLLTLWSDDDFYVGSSSYPLKLRGSAIEIQNAVDVQSALRARNGIHGGYSALGGQSSTFGATIWGIGASYDGAVAGANSSAAGVYGLRWHRSTHVSANSNIGEGIYVYQNGSLDGGIGSSGMYSANGLHVAGDAYFGGDTIGHFETVSGDYGSVQCSGAEGSSGGSWGGYSIGGRLVFMDNAGTATTNRGGLFDDQSNSWVFQYNADSASKEFLVYVNGVSHTEFAASNLSATANVRAMAGNSLFAYGPTNVDYIRANHNGSNAGITTNAGSLQFNINTGAGVFDILYGSNLWVRNTDNTKYINIEHDGTDAVVEVPTGDGAMKLRAYGLTQIKLQDQTLTGNTTGATVLTHGSTATDIGLNKLPLFNFNASDTLEARHCGHATGKTNTTAYTLTGPTSSDVDFPVNGVTTVMNLGSSGNYTISDTTTCTMYYVDGSSVTDIAGSGTLAPGGIVTLWRYDTSNIYIFGSGFTA